MNWEALLVTYWVYLPLVAIILILALIYKRYLKHYKYKRMVESVRGQKRVNLSPWTNWRLLVITLFIIAVSLGLIWSGYSTYEVLIYSLGMLFVYYLIEIVYRKIRAEAVGLVEKLAGVTILFILALIAYYQGYNIPQSEMQKAVLDLHLKVSNASYTGAPVAVGDLTKSASAQVVFITPDNVEHTVGTVTDDTNRVGGDGSGWTEYIFDLTPYIETNIVGSTVKVKWLYDSGEDCANVKDLSIIVNKLKGVYADGYKDKIVTSCPSDKASGNWQGATIDLK